MITQCSQCDRKLRTVAIQSLPLLFRLPVIVLLDQVTRLFIFFRHHKYSLTVGQNVILPKHSTRLITLPHKTVKRQNTILPLLEHPLAVGQNVILPKHSTRLITLPHKNCQEAKYHFALLICTQHRPDAPQSSTDGLLFHDPKMPQFSYALDVWSAAYLGAKLPNRIYLDPLPISLLK